MKWHVWILMIFLGSNAAILSKASYKNELTKILLHRGDLSDKLVCFFSKDPVCNVLPQTKLSNDNSNNKLSKKRFFLPLTKAYAKQVKHVIDNLDKIQNGSYTIAFHHVQKPMQGTIIEITYNPIDITFEYDHFESIGAQQGIIFKFHHKSILNKLKEKTDNIVRVAYNREKPTIILDFGHGGEDTGAIGFFQLKESVLIETIGKQIVSKLKKKAIELS